MAMRLDPNMAVRDPDGSTVWYDLAKVGVEGMGWADTKGPFQRLPARAEGLVRDPVWRLAADSAGICARFVTDAQQISCRWTIDGTNLAMDHMPATGVSGVDLYVRVAGGGWRWVGIGRPTEVPTNRKQLTGRMEPGRREYMLYFPLYNGVTEISLGLPPEAVLEKAPSRRPLAAKPVVFYGTSIVQGGCASRPGMAYPAILGRWLNVPTINLGFSGNGRMEPEIAKLLAELDAAAFVLDALPNVEAMEVTERTRPMVETIRKAHPVVPIVLVENVVYQDSHLVAARRGREETSNAALRAAVDAMLAAGVRGLYYVRGDQLLGDDGEATVDGVHATDLGFLRLATAIRPALEKALGRY